VPVTGAAVSVVIPFKTDSAWLRECLDHLERQTFRSFNVILVPDVASALGGFGVHIIASGPVLPNAKRAIAAAASTAPIVAFIDDDAYPAPEWLASAMRHFADPNVVACGGPAITPESDSPGQRASGAIFAAPIVTATTRHRYHAETQRDVESLPSCNLLIRRDAFLRDADSSASFWPGEDILVCHFATRDGGRIVYDPAALVYHHRRTVFAAHLRQVWSYGLFRGHFLRHYHRSWRNAAYAVPSAFVLAHAVMLPLLAMRKTRRFADTMAGLYAGIVCASAIHESSIARTRPLLVAVGIYLTHLTYGAGVITGWLRKRARDD
jgi:GT2 family glycosyltransferase